MCHQNSLSEGEGKSRPCPQHFTISNHEVKGKEGVQVENNLYNKNNRPNNNNNLTILINN